MIFCFILFCFVLLVFHIKRFCDDKISVLLNVLVRENSFCIFAKFFKELTFLTTLYLLGIIQLVHQKKLTFLACWYAYGFLENFANILNKWSLMPLSHWICKLRFPCVFWGNWILLTIIKNRENILLAKICATLIQWFCVSSLISLN